jgi:hypothetical protein
MQSKSSLINGWRVDDGSRIVRTEMLHVPFDSQDRQNGCEGNRAVMLLHKGVDTTPPVSLHALVRLKIVRGTAALQLTCGNHHQAP